jgi:predicted Zn-dependent peptidase
MRHSIKGGTVAVLFGALLFASGLCAATSPKVQFTDTRLKNGLRVIISEDHMAPVFSIAVTYNVGSRNERQGRTGFAHLFEHMMFKGSQNVGSGEHFLLVYTNGGDMNVEIRTGRTITNACESARSGFVLEADRMRALDINKTNLDNQIGTVSRRKQA